MGLGGSGCDCRGQERDVWELITWFLIWVLVTQLGVSCENPVDLALRMCALFLVFILYPIESKNTIV